MLLGLGMWMILSASGTAQTDQWTTVTFGDLKCEFPAAYSPIEFTGASGIFYDGGNMYLTVTSLPDTSSMKGNENRDYTRDFMNVVLDVSRKLQGRVREFRDTVIANRPGYISRMEISLPDGKKSYYELLQLLHQDSMRGFSCQYFAGDPEGYKVSQRFFGSIGVTTPKKSQGLFTNPVVWIAVVLILAAAIWVIFRQKPQLKNPPVRPKKLKAKAS
jgi:hypothetical protein